MLHSTTSIPGRAREVRPTTAAAAQESEKTADEDSHAASLGGSRIGGRKEEAGNGSGDATHARVVRPPVAVTASVARKKGRWITPRMMRRGTANQTRIARCETRWNGVDLSVSSTDETMSRSNLSSMTIHRPSPSKMCSTLPTMPCSSGCTDRYLAIYGGNE